MNLLLTVILTSLFWACEKSDPDGPPDPPVVQQDTIIDYQWVTRMDFEEDVITTDNVIHYKDWVVLGYDDDERIPKVMAFNKLTGEREWDMSIPDIYNEQLIHAVLHDNIYIGRGLKSVYAIDLDNQSLLWQENLNAMGTRVGRITLASNGKVYVKADFSFGSAGQVLHVYEFDPFTGANRMVYSKPPDSTGIYSCSPPAIWFDEELGKEILILNLFPDSFAPPEEGDQYLVGVDPDDRYTELFSIPVVEKFSSNGGHPPLIYNDAAYTGGWDKMFCFDLVKKEMKWDKDFGYPWAIWSKTQHLMNSNRLYVNNGQFDVTCLNPINGIEIWNNPEGGPNSTDNMVYYEKEDLLVFTSWGYGSVMVLDGLTGQTIHREKEYDFSSFNNDVVYDEDLDMFFTCTYKHVMGFKINKPD
jgi:outer membrane protein assembly factor BamB